MPRRLYFVRHGLADRAAFSGDDDRRRPLTDQGQEQLQRQAEVMACLDLGVDLIVTSPLLRAEQTAAILADALAPTGGLVVDPRLGLSFAVGPLARLLDEHGDARRMMLVGHEPSFSEVIGSITGGSAVACRKASLIRVDLRSERPLHGSLEWSIPARVLLEVQSRG